MKEKFFEDDKKRASKFQCLITFIVLSGIFLTTTIIFIVLFAKLKNEKNSEKDDSVIIEYPSPERFIKVLTRLTENKGSFVKQSKHDIYNSTYFNYLDIYNMKSSGSLILLEKFKTYQQTSPYSCGPASIIMAIHYLDGTILDEEEVVKKAKTDNTTGTLAMNIDKAISELGYSFDSKFNYTEENLPSRDEISFSKYIKESLKNNESIIVLSEDWNGHYSVIIGYDDMGTDVYYDDIIILADPYDTSDHISDGYTIFNYQRFYAQMKEKIFDPDMEKLYFNRIKRKVKN
jgi:predicted double-glycine peptidase